MDDVVENYGISILEQGGLIVWPILLIGFISILLYIERILYIRKGQIKGRDFIEGIKNLMRKKRHMEALTICEEHSGPMVNVLKSILLNYDNSKETITEEVRTAAQIEIALLERRLPILALIVHIAPTFGLLGTFLSIFTTFNLSSHQGPYLNSADFTTILASALITTIAGIIVGLLAQIFYAFLNSKIRSMIDDTEWAAHNLMQFVLSDEIKSNEK